LEAQELQSSSTHHPFHRRPGLAIKNVSCSSQFLLRDRYIARHMSPKIMTTFNSLVYEVELSTVHDKGNLGPPNQKERTTSYGHATFSEVESKRWHATTNVTLHSSVPPSHNLVTLLSPSFNQGTSYSTEVSIKPMLATRHHPQIHLFLPEPSPHRLHNRTTSSNLNNSIFPMNYQHERDVFNLR
jgi:hypothetical protein